MIKNTSIFIASSRDLFPDVDSDRICYTFKSRTLLCAQQIKTRTSALQLTLISHAQASSDFIFQSSVAFCVLSWKRKKIYFPCSTLLWLRLPITSRLDKFFCMERPFFQVPNSYMPGGVPQTFKNQIIHLSQLVFLKLHIHFPHLLRALLTYRSAPLPTESIRTGPAEETLREGEGCSRLLSLPVKKPPHSARAGGPVTAQPLPQPSYKLFLC